MSKTRPPGAPPTQPATRQPKWTVMVFMVAERVSGDADLVSAALDDIGEMEELFQDRPDGLLDLFVQLHGVELDGKKGPWRFHIGRGPREAVDPFQSDPTDGKALTEFMRWSFERSKPQPEDYSMLVLWGHAYRFALGRVENQSGVDALDFAELASVLKRFQSEQDRTLDIVGFDACELATIEVAYQLRRYAKYLLASQIGIPIPGWPYNRIFDRIKVPKVRQMGPAELGSYIVRRFCETYKADHLTVSLTLLDLRLSEQVVRLTEQLSRRLALVLARDPAESERIFDSFVRSQTLESKPFVDVADLCVNLLRRCRDRDVKEAAEKLGDLLISAAPVDPGQSVTGEGRPFVAEHGRNACQTARLQGVNLYAPHVAPTFDVETADGFYGKLAFARETLWSDVVHALAQSNA